MSRDSLSLWVARLYLVLAFYVLGALVLENEVNYGTWHLIDPAGFGAYHRALEARLGPALFAPMTLQLLLNLLLVWVRPPSLPRGWVLAALALHGYVIVESLLVQVPLHAQLDHGSTKPLLDRLIHSHRVFRLPAEVAAFGVDLAFLVRLTRPGRDP